MRFGYTRVAGFLIFVGGVQCVLAIILAEALYPGYSSSKNWISDLGVGPSATVFNSTMILLGVLGIAGAYFVQQAFHSRIFPFLMTLASIGAIGVGVFPENVPPLHSISSSITFLFAALSALSSYKLQKPPLSHISVILGAFALLALILTFTGTYLGLGKGGMERMIAYPELLWLISFGSYLIGCSNNMSRAR